jgi:membrane protease YdiL (CAAX protease family)
MGVQLGMALGTSYALRTRVGKHIMLALHIPVEALEANFLEWITLIVIAVSDIVSLVIFTLLWRKERKKSNSNNSKLSMLTAVLITCFSITFSLIINYVVAAVIQYFPSFAVVEEFLSMGSLTFQLVFFCVVGPIVEELCFRGLILKRLLNWVPTRVAVLVTSFLFGLIHWNPLQSMYCFVVGIALALLYVRFRNIWAPVILHMVFNFAYIMLSQFFTKIALPLIPSFITFVSLSGLFGWLLSKRPAATVNSLKETKTISSVRQ